MIEIKEHPARNRGGGPLLPCQRAVYLSGKLVAYVNKDIAVQFIQPLCNPDVEEIVQAIRNELGEVTKIHSVPRGGSSGQRNILKADHAENQNDNG